MTTATVGLPQVIAVGQTQLGVPYKLGSDAGRSIWTNAKQIYFDCSGFIAWAYYQTTGIKLPAYTGSLATDPHLVQVASPQIGDIVLFPGPNGHFAETEAHAALYAGNGQVLEAGSADSSRSNVNFMPLLTQLHPSYFRLKDAVVSQPVVSPGNPPPASGGQTGGFTLGTGPDFGGSVGQTPLASGTQLASIGGVPLNIPSGLVLGALAVLLLVLGVLLFAFNLEFHQQTVRVSPAGVKT